MPPCDNATWTPKLGEFAIAGGQGNNPPEMMIWFAFAGLTAAVVGVLALPFLQRRESLPDRASFDRAVYLDQLAELDRDEARAIVGETEAGAARNEISRRLIQSAAQRQQAKPRRSTLAAAGLLLIPLAVPLYFLSGSPLLPDVPLKPRLDRAIESQDYMALIAKVEQHLASNPGDVEGWKVLAPAYKKLQRWSDAADAFGNVARLAPGDANAREDQAEMLVFAGEGMVTAEAGRVFADALALDPKLPKARFFQGLALKQKGNSAGARATFAALLADSPVDAAWRPMLEAELASLQSLAPALTEDQIATGKSMEEKDRQAMIRSMVDGLEEKLKSDATDLDGWQRLIRARSVLGEVEKAKAALATARQQFKNRPEAFAALASLAREVGLE